MGARTQSVTRNANGFVIRDAGRELPIRLSEVVSVDGTKVDKVTHEENFLVLTKADGTKIPIGELAEGFAEFEQAIGVSLNGFPKEWRVAVEKEPEGKYVSLWAQMSC